MWIYLLDKYLGVEWLGHRVGVCLKLKLPKVFQKQLFHFILLAMYECSRQSRFWPTITAINILILPVLLGL